LTDDEVMGRFETTDLVALKKRMHHFKGSDDIKSNDRAFARALVERWDEGRNKRRMRGINLD